MDIIDVFKKFSLNHKILIAFLAVALAGAGSGYIAGILSAVAVALLFFNFISKRDKAYRDLQERFDERTRALDQETDKLSRITQYMDEGAILLDTEGNTLFATKRAREILGAELGGVKEALFTKFANFRVREHFRKCSHNKPSRIPEAETEDGRVFSISFQCLQILKGLYYGHLIWLRDITEEKALERSKSEFVAIASHQLRTPATIVKGNIEMLLDQSFGKLNKEQRNILEQADAGNTRMILLVNDMLDVTKIERGQMEFELEDLDMEEILKSIISDIEDYAEKYGVSISYEKSKEAISTVRGDRMRVRQVLQNLIDNAVRYSRHPGGEVDVSFRVSGKMLEAKVSDNGIGIPEAEKGKIFSRFYRASNAVKFSSGGGTGLGLYFAKSVVEKSGGKIWFASEEGKGTTFYFTLPIKR